MSTSKVGPTPSAFEKNSGVNLFTWYYINHLKTILKQT